MDFHLVRTPACRQGNNECQNVYKASGKKNIVLHISEIAPDDARIRNLTVTQSEQLDIHLATSHQYALDMITDQANKLAEITRAMQCELKKMRRNQAVFTAQYNGWLAATQLGFPKCAKLIDTGKRVTPQKRKSVEFKTEVTKCGPQPRYENFTINLDGWELVNSSPRYCSQGFVNFNDQPYVFKNGEWDGLQPDMQTTS